MERTGVSSRPAMDFTKDLSGRAHTMAVFVSIAKRLLDSSPWPDRHSVEIASSLPEDQKYGNLVRRLDQSRDRTRRVRK